jgi:hypothetical protein
MRAAGAVAYLTKPLDLAEVLRVIDDAVADAEIADGGSP